MKLEKKINYREKGITLVALMVTIIVLLILAGITINLAVGENGIVKKAGESSEKMEYESLKEEVQMVLMKRQMGINTKILKEDLEEALSGQKQVTEASGITDACYVKRGKSEITAYEDGETLEGKVSVWDGSTIECPEFKAENNTLNWYIYTAGQLNFLEKYVNNGNSLTGETDLTAKVIEAGYTVSEIKIEDNKTVVKLINNLDLGARPVEGEDEETKWETTSNEAKKWTPIGLNNSTKKFNGIFEGNNKTIKGVYVNSTKSDAGHGLFGNSNTIQNLTVNASYITGENCTAGIVGILRSGTIENCHNKSTTVIIKEGESRAVGGVVGQLGGNAINCTNNGKIIGKGIGNNGHSTVGGVIGQTTTSPQVIAEKCTNNGLVTGNGDIVGGVVGALQGTSIVKECNNKGNVIGNKSVGGIVGSNKYIITKCNNMGNVVGNLAVGGIIGGNMSNATQDVSFCYNSGDVTGNEKNVGGISGNFGIVNYSQKEEKCYNKGKVINKSNDESTGGIIGKAAKDSTVTNCYYLSNIGVNYGVGTVGDEGDIEALRAGARATDVDLKNYEEFISWINEQN